jgi:hypothetical protein
MSDDPKNTPGDPKKQPTGGHTDPPDTTPAEERGARLDTGKTIAIPDGSTSRRVSVAELRERGAEAIVREVLAAEGR